MCIVCFARSDSCFDSIDLGSKSGKKATLAPGQFSQLRAVLAGEEALLGAGPGRGKVFVVLA